MIPIRWMKSGELPNIWWLMEKEGTQWHDRYIKCKSTPHLPVCEKIWIKFNYFCYCVHRLWFSLLRLFTSTVVNTEMNSGDKWILANINVTGFYRVNYDIGNWERLTVQLNSDHKVHTNTQSNTHWGVIVRELRLASNQLFSCNVFHLAVQVLPLINRAQLVDDIFNLARYVFF